MSIIHHTKRQLKIFNKSGQLISTLTRTLCEASVAEEEDRRRCRGRGDNTEDGAVDVCSGPFRRRARVASRPAVASSFSGEKLSTVLRAHAAAGGGEWDRPAGTSEHTDRASDLLMKESECCYRNRSDLLRRESKWCRKEKTQTR
jgi:hypothetical protein